jgi:N-acetylmuramoyl-L-alanine amidase
MRYPVYAIAVLFAMCGFLTFAATTTSADTFVYQPPSQPTTIKEKPRHIDEADMICLAKNIFFEARGTDENERIKIINVTTNRVESPKFGGTYCDVVYKHAQFSWTLNLRKHNPIHYITEWSSWQHAQAMAAYELAHGYPDMTKGATYYKTRWCHPRWAHHKKIVLATRYHIYYTDPNESEDYNE